jgi:hypothetical protein
MHACPMSRAGQNDRSIGHRQRMLHRDALGILARAFDAILELAIPHRKQADNLAVEIALSSPDAAGAEFQTLTDPVLMYGCR